MATDTVAASGSEVMAAIDDDDDDGSRLVIADVSADETWLSVPADAAASLAEWR